MAIVDDLADFTTRADICDMTAEEVVEQLQVRVLDALGCALDAVDADQVRRLAVFDGDKGFMHVINGPFAIDWATGNLDRIRRAILKRYNAEIHSQSAIAALLDCAPARLLPSPTPTWGTAGLWGRVVRMHRQLGVADE